MKKNEKLEIIKNAVETALSQYGADNVDMIKNEENGVIDIMYHSRHNSFPIVSNVCTSSGLSEFDVSNIADYYDIGYCW